MKPCFLTALISGTDVARVTAAFYRNAQNALHIFFSRRGAFSGPETTLLESEKECLSLQLMYIFGLKNIC